MLNSTISTLRNKDLKHRFQLALQRASLWDESPLTDIGVVYLHSGRDVSWTSMSEAYEQGSSILVNFVSSTIGEPVAVIEKDHEMIQLASYSDSLTLLDYVVSKGWHRRQYDLSSNHFPLDEESILADSSKFAPTNHRYNGRVIYRRIGTNHLCYIDSNHSGLSAHIEEFNEATKMMVQKLKINEDAEFRPLSKNEMQRKLRMD